MPLPPDFWLPDEEPQRTWVILPFAAPLHIVEDEPPPSVLLGMARGMERTISWVVNHEGRPITGAVRTRIRDHWHYFALVYAWPAGSIRTPADVGVGWLKIPNRLWDYFREEYKHRGVSVAKNDAEITRSVKNGQAWWGATLCTGSTLNLIRDRRPDVMQGIVERAREAVLAWPGAG
jgi:hypothetical protein